LTKIKAIVLTAAIALAALSSATASATADGKSIHVQGRGTGTIKLNTATGAFTGRESGVMSHLGKYTLQLQGTGTPAADGAFTGNGNVTITAANGDRLTGTFTVSGNGETQRVVVTITGGTGRFANASGTLTVVCVTDGPPSQEGPVLVLQHHCSTKGELSR
jgi:hypothetical protein